MPEMSSNAERAHRVLAVLSILAAVVNSSSAILLEPDSWFLGPALWCCAGFVYAGAKISVLSSASGRGRDIILAAQVAGTGMLGWALLWNRSTPWNPPLLMGAALMSGILAFGLAMVAYPRAVGTFFADVAEEPPAEPEPADTPPVPANPDLHRYSHVLLKLRSRGYR